MENQAEYKTREPQAVVWLSCRKCQRPLVPVDFIVTAEGARRVIRIHNLIIYRSSIVCQYCGKSFDFRSREIKADLGIIDNKKPIS